MGLSCAKHEPPCRVEECSPYLLLMHPVTAAALRFNHGILLPDATAPLFYSHVSMPSVRAGRKSVQRCLALLASKIPTPSNILIKESRNFCLQLMMQAEASTAKASEASGSGQVNS